MRTIRPNVFETNSSSAHCIVVADQESFRKFKEGELFADEWWYKCPYQADLITFDKVYNMYINAVNAERDWARIHHLNEDFFIVSKTLLKWLFDHPNVVDEMGEEETEQYVREHTSGKLQDELLTCINGRNWFAWSWVYDQYHPISYEMIRYFTKDFETEYDDYRCVAPHENADGQVEMEAVWYY